MHDHRIAPAAVLGSREFEHQRYLLLELVTQPPGRRDEFAYFARVLRIPSEAVESAADVLVALGLAVRAGRRLSPTPSARAVDWFWPLGR